MAMAGRSEGNLGSLLRMFQSEYFDIHMLMHFYLNAKKLEEVEFYLPQVCKQLIERGSRSLERFILHLCIQNTNVGLKAYWQFQSAREEAAEDQVDFLDKLAHECEMAIVNGEQKLANFDGVAFDGMEITPIFNIPIEDLTVQKKKKKQKAAKNIENQENGVGHQESPSSEKVIEADQKIFQSFINKQLRAEFFNYQIRFAEFLVETSINLKQYEVTERNVHLHKALDDLNKWIDEERVNHAENGDYARVIFRGAYLPFEEMSEHPWQILNISVDASTCFSTRARVPFKIVFETISMLELQDLDVGSRSTSVIDEDEKVEVPLRSERVGRKSFSTADDHLDVEVHPIVKSMSMSIPHCETEGSGGESYRGIGEFFEKIQLQEQRTHSVDESSRGSPTKSKDNLTVVVPENDVEQVKKIVRNSDLSPKGRKKKLKTRSAGNSPVNKHSVSKFDFADMREVSKFIRKHHAIPNFEIIDQKPLLQSPWGQKWEDAKQKILENSLYAHLPTYQIRSYIVKGADDVRQEHMVMQVMRRLKSIFEQAELPIFLRPYDILITSSDSGIIECINDGQSLDSIKKSHPDYTSLLNYYLEIHGQNFEEAQKNFTESLAGYSLLTYLLLIKDRHNANILFDSQGHIIHIDFGFVISNSPGGVGFESAPFKLTAEMVELMGGPESEMYFYFKALLLKAIIALRKHTDSLILLVESMMKDSKFPCFANAETGLALLKERMNFNMIDHQCYLLVERLVDESCDNW
eukprot:CAMPEP_0115021058 /NCGR_PEP_ID=MMETSP0216-20121206/30626_1 /TAXON_ID=223996 /ORGANISM="Protocruzia adherens, Strain Boccale" /LENGTH=750 /DNA_ID=CAMNT_0002393273 /DNA_START=40 /DNA_END=2290 /DNA_ORIENTATION=+